MKLFFQAVTVFLLSCFLLPGCIPVCGWAGSYPCVKYWDLKVPERQLIAILWDLKEQHPELQLPPGIRDREGRDSYWYHVDFYLPKSREIVYTWVRSDSDSLNVTTFALIGFSDADGNNYRGINRDYGWAGNALHINMFKHEILEPVREKIAELQQP